VGKSARGKKGGSGRGGVRVGSGRKARKEGDGSFKSRRKELAAAKLPEQSVKEGKKPEVRLEESEDELAVYEPGDGDGDGEYEGEGSEESSESELSPEDLVAEDDESDEYGEDDEEVERMKIDRRRGGAVQRQGWETRKRRLADMERE